MCSGEATSVLNRDMYIVPLVSIPYNVFSRGKSTSGNYTIVYFVFRKEDMYFRYLHNVLCKGALVLQVSIIYNDQMIWQIQIRKY